MEKVRIMSSFVARVELVNNKSEIMYSFFDQKKKRVIKEISPANYLRFNRNVVV